MNLDPNSWYRLTTAAAMTSQLSLVGRFPYMTGKKGAVSYSTSDNGAPGQSWQLFPVGSSYMLRTKASGPEGYLGTTQITTENDTVSQPKPWILSRTDTDASMLWKIHAWGDGTFSLSNSADGANCHLDFTGTQSVDMSSNVTQPQPGQAFSFIQLEEINDIVFSTVKKPPARPSTSTFPSTSVKPTLGNSQSSAIALDVSPLSKSLRTTSLSRTLPASTPTSTSTAPRVSSSSSPAFTDVTSSFPSNTHVLVPSPTTSRNPTPRLSTSASMGVGVTIGVFGLISLTAIGLFLYQRWKKRRDPETLHYRRAKLWKGFTPQYPSCAKIDTKYLDRIVVAELPTPASVLSPPFSGDHRSWHSSSSSYSQQYVPYSPDTPGPSPVELPV